MEAVFQINKTIKKIRKLDVNDNFSDSEDIEEIEDSGMTQNRNQEIVIHEEEWEDVTERELENVIGEKNAKLNIDISNKSPFEIFSLIFTDEIFELLAVESNRYFQQFIRDNPFYIHENKQSKISLWEDMNPNKIKSFLGILYLMSINIRTNRDDHWSSNEYLRSVVSEHISSDKFNLVWRFLHCSNNDIITKRIDKINNILELFICQWNKYYIHSSKLAVDETMIPYRGRSNLVQYIPSKPTKYGIKSWSLADSSNGYMLNMKIYEGKSQTKFLENLSFRVVKELISKYLGNNFTLYMDSFFSSPLLFEFLFLHGINCIGMLMINRKFLSNEIKESSKNDENKIFKNNNLLLLQYKDKKKFNLLSTIKNSVDIEVETYDKKLKKYVLKEKPVLIIDYTHSMKAVDINNQLSSYYSIDVKNFKWWRCILLKIFDVSMSNAYILYKNFVDSSLDHKSFHLHIVENLLKFYTWKKSIDLNLDISIYFETLENQKKLKRCKGCSSAGIRTQTYFYCVLCFNKSKKFPSFCQGCQKNHLLSHIK